MIHSIANDYFRVKVQEKGAEVCSMVSQQSGEEYMWDGNTEVWGSTAPVLFPIIGVLKDGHVLYKGKPYAIPKHGIVRNSEKIKLKSRTNNRLNFQLESDEETLAVYPFDFDFQISFHLVGSHLAIGHKISNTGDEPMYFSLGGHPAFKCPLNSKFDYSDYSLEFEQVENFYSHELNEQGLVMDAMRTIAPKSEVLHLSEDMFDKDALIFTKLKSRKVSLINKVNYQQLTLSFSDFNNLGIWAKPGGKFICIEPWLGISDGINADGNIENKNGMLTLEPGAHFMAQYTIEVEE